MSLLLRKCLVKLFTILFIVVGFPLSQNVALAAITATAIAQAANTTNATTQATTAFTPAANRLYLMWTVQTITAGPPTTPTVACTNGLTMDQITTRTFSTNATPLKRITLFRGLRTSVGTSNTCTITWGQTALSYGYAIVGFDGVDTSGTNGSGAVVQSVVGSTDSAPAATGLSLALSTILSGSATAGGFSNIDNNGSALTAGTGYTANTLVRANNDPIALRAEWEIAGSATVNMTQRTTNDIGGIAVEIRQPASGSVSASPTTCTILSGGSTCTVPFTWSISNAISPNLYNSTTATQYSTSASGSGVSFAITNGSNTVQARDSSTVLASTSVTASCTSGTSWNGTSCAPSSAVPTVTSPTASAISTSTATIGATVTSLGIPASISARGTCLGTTPAPTNCSAEGGTTTGTFTQNWIGLTPSTQYYYRGYATNSTGTGYSSDGTFTSLAVPTVTSPTVTGITTAGATLGANITSLGIPASISARGTCWGTSPSPLTNCTAEGGTTTGVFTQGRTGMNSNTFYYYRGYATNSTGTGYSTDGTFTTNAGASGSVSAAPTTCTILSGASTCTVPFTWSISNAISPNLYNSTTATQYSTSASGSGVSFAITNGSNTVQARDSSTVLASTSVTASCTSGTSWNGSSCAVNAFTITASSGANGSVTPSGITNVASGGSQTYNITPDSGYTVATLLVDSVSVATSTTYTFTNVQASHTISATFSVSATPTFNIVASSGANGSVTPAGTTAVSQGASQLYNITPDSGYTVATLVVDAVSIATSTTYTFTNVQAAHTISATFSLLPVTHTITSSTGSNGTLSPLGATVVSDGGSQTYNIIPDSGFTVETLTVDSVSTATSTSYTFNNVTADHTISATFALIPPPPGSFTIVANQNSNGTVSPAGSTVVTQGASQTYSITPNSGYYIDTLIIDSFTVATSTSYTFTNVQADHTIEATFALVVVPPGSFSIVATTGANGSVSPSGTTVVTQGNSQIYTITPNSGYDVATLTVDSVSVATSTSYTFTNVQADHTITATFALLPGETAVITPGPILASITFSGKAFPGGKISVVQKGLDTEKLADQQDVSKFDGSFHIRFVDLPKGIHSFGLLVKDPEGRTSQTKFFLVDANDTNPVFQNIVVPPTIDILNGQVTRGTNLKVFGYASPSHTVRLYLNDILVKEMLAGNSGVYSFELPTGALDFKQYQIRAKQINLDGGKESDFSTSRTFIVSKLTVVKADLNGDGKIDIRDWSIFLSRWGNKNSLGRAGIDLNSDGKVDIADFSIFIKTIRK